MPSTNNKKAADMQYNKLHTRQINMRFTRHDADILAALDTVTNKQGYIKSLIRADMARAKSDATRANSEIEEEKAMNTTTYAINNDPTALPIDKPEHGLLLRKDTDRAKSGPSAQNLDGTDPGVPAGPVQRLWYAIVLDEEDDSEDWSVGSFRLDSAARLAQNLPGAKILVIDNSQEFPFVTEEIDPREI